MRTHLTKRYRYLLTGEALSVAVFIFLYISLVRRDDWHWEKWLLRGYALACVLFILLEGVLLWAHKYRQLQRGEVTLSPIMRRWLPRWRRLNWILIAIYPALTVVRILLFPPIEGTDVVIGTMIWLFAIAEQVNYYYFQLCYDNSNDISYLLTHKQLKQGFVARDLNP